MTLDELYLVIKERQVKMPRNSYTTTLFKEGSDRIIQKIGEEATEVVIAAKNGLKKEIINESADLFFHMLVLFSITNVTLDNIMDELERRSKSR